MSSETAIRTHYLLVNPFVLTSLSGIIGDYHLRLEPIPGRGLLTIVENTPHRPLEKEEWEDFCPCAAWAEADRIWKEDFTQADRDLWRAALKRPHLSNYDLWMKEALTAFNAAHYAPDIPSVSGGYTTKEIIYGETHPPPKACRPPPPQTCALCQDDPTPWYFRLHFSGTFGACWREQGADFDLYQRREETPCIWGLQTQTGIFRFEIGDWYQNLYYFPLPYDPDNYAFYEAWEERPCLTGGTLQVSQFSGTCDGFPEPPDAADYTPYLYPY